MSKTTKKARERYKNLTKEEKERMKERKNEKCEKKYKKFLIFRLCKFFSEI